MEATDQVAQSLALIEVGLVEDPPWLSRRRRHAALAVNVDGDLACTVFMHRYNSGALEQRIDVHTRRRGTWVSVGDHRSNVDDDRLSDRPAAATLGGLVYVVDTGVVQTNADRAFPWPARNIHYALLRAAREINTVTVAHRSIPVPRHGHVVAVWNTRHAPRVVAHGDHQSTRIAVPLRPDRTPHRTQRWRCPDQPPWWW